MPSFGRYLPEVAGAIAVRSALPPDLFESVAAVWLDLAQPWGHVEARMRALLARIDTLTANDATALAVTGATPDFPTAGVTAHLAGRDFMFNSGFWTSQWRVWRAAARATGLAEMPFRQADYAQPWPNAVMMAAAAAVALACEPMIDPGTALELTKPWRDAIGAV